MLEFGAERDAQAFVKKTYLILREGAKLIQSELVWLQRNYRAGVIPIVTRAVTKPPYDVLCFTGVEGVLEVNVEDVLMVCKKRILGNVRAVIVHLQRRRGIREGVIPTAQKVASANAPLVGKGARIGSV